MRHFVYNITILGLTLVSCSDSKFSGGTDKKNVTRAPTADAISENEIEEKASVEEEKIVPVISVPAEEVIEKVVSGVCTEKLDYDPSSILCALKEDSNITTWELDGPWTPRVKSLKNQVASWISPLEMKKGKDHVYCPSIPKSEKTLYVSHFMLGIDQEIKLEALIDDLGQVRLWKNADPKQEVYLSASDPKVDAAIALKKGHYSLIIDSEDIGYASGAIASVFGQDGKLLRQTEASQDWCIFRVQKNTDIPSFLSSSSSCRPCMIGHEKLDK